jgi:maleylpyruvate isomerase
MGRPRENEVVDLPGVERALETARDATAQVDTMLADMTDAQARRPSRLPGWTRGHVATHLARNADGNRAMVEGVLAGEERAMYPGGEDRRDADIEAGAGRPAAELLEDFRSSARALDDAWDRVPDDAWDGTGVTLFAGSVPISMMVLSRCRELFVHMVDLDLGVTPSDLPSEYVELDRDWLREQRRASTWPDAPWV